MGLLEQIASDNAEIKDKLNAIFRRLNNQDKESLAKCYKRIEAAKLLGLTKGTLTNKINLGIIKTTADGQFITQAEINRYLNL